jgi:hypothetical protein
MTSKIKVDNIADQDDNNIINESGDVITVGAAGDTVAVAGNIVKSNALQASDGGNIVNQSGTTITLGASGDTVSLASGASQSGFGRAGSVDWQTGSIKTGNFTAANGEGYFVNTTSGAITVTLPASPSGGAIVAVKDYAQTFATNNCTIARNSSNIEGVASDAVLDGNAESVTFVYVDSTKGWVLVNEATSVYGPQFISATGGTITTSGNFKIHTFTGPGTFTVSCAGNSGGSNTVSYLVVGGGAGGGGSALSFYSAGGGGAGGFRESKAASDCYSASPLNATSGPTYNLPVSAQGYPITVGGGGARGGGSSSPAPGSCRSPGSEGTNSVFSTITAARGGSGGESGANPGTTPNGGVSGGSGGGGGGYNSNPDGGLGAGNTPPVSPPQGNPGGAGSNPSAGHGGGGGGATAAGTGSTSASGHNNAGGAGAATSISASPVTYAVGGNAGADCNSAADAGTTNRGNGGQGGNNYAPDAGGGTGGSGIVIIRYKFQ